MLIDDEELYQKFLNFIAGEFFVPDELNRKRYANMLMGIAHSHRSQSLDEVRVPREYGGDGIINSVNYRKKNGGGFIIDIGEFRDVD